MRLHLSPQEKNKLARHGNTGNRKLPRPAGPFTSGTNGLSAELLAKPSRYCRLAIEIDPAWQAHAVMADCYTTLSVFGALRAKEAFPRAKAAATEAVEMAPSLSDAHLAVGLVSLYFDWDWDAAERHMRL